MPKSGIAGSYFCFIDCAKVFGCVDHNKLWKILKEMGYPVWDQSVVPCPTLTVLPELHTDFSEAGQVVWYSHLSHVRLFATP